MSAARRQAGLTLIELLVGLSIGLMTIAVALGALVVSRSVSGTVSDASQMQQQAAFALRTIGQQLRQAGSIRLNLAFGQATEPTAIDPAEPVAFETDFNRAAGTLGGDSTVELSIGYQNYTEDVGQASPQSLLRNCLGQQPSATVIQSSFWLDKATGAATGDLKCTGVAGDKGQGATIISNVADFQVRYFLQQAGPTMRYATAANVGTNWPAVVAVEVCFEIVGEESVQTAGATYRNCSWKAGDAEAAMGNRMRMVFRNVFQIRSQGVPR
ncbi:PilW family protein [Pseudorhodoferax sp. Leaf267]|uniref:PilW family protein n=1 Tax=Pseudorhodoferax sp. Leaf267 TaxID=1736316 RepID=UPI001910124C|nr:PilW family protein [Pseudorhodoferax sp. Leaf267]